MASQKADDTINEEEASETSDQDDFVQNARHLNPLKQ